jgi:hypothetical protein
LVAGAATAAAAAPDAAVFACSPLLAVAFALGLLATALPLLMPRSAVLLMLLELLSTSVYV